ncbi:MAG: SCO6880 family protein [Solirubrobacteraceae bacterium]
MSGVRDHLLGPRAKRGLFGYLSVGQVAIGGCAGAAAIVVVAAWPTIPGLLAAIAIAMAGATGMMMTIQSLPVTHWVPSSLVFVVERLAGRRVWRSPVPGSGVTAERPVRPVALPPQFGQLEIVSVGGADGRQAGMTYDRERNCLVGVLELRLQAFGLRDVAEQDRQLETIGTLENDLARPGSPVRRMMFLRRTTPQQASEMASYLRKKLAKPVGCGPVQAMLGAMDSTATGSQEHVLYMGVQTSAVPRDRRRGEKREQERERAGEAGVRELERVNRYLQMSEITVKSPAAVLTPTDLSYLYADLCDPFERRLLDQLRLRDGARDPRPWPLALDDGWPFVRLDGADHVVWWIPEWPPVPVQAGWWQALTLQCEAPIVTIAVVCEPVPIRQARAQARRRLTGDRADIETRAKHQMVETSQDRARRWQGEREEQELAEGSSPWRYEAFIAAAVPAGAGEQRRLVRDQVEAACVQAGLVPAFMYGLQLDHFLCTLPLCRGMR